MQLLKVIYIFASFDYKSLSCRKNAHRTHIDRPRSEHEFNKNTSEMYQLKKYTNCKHSPMCDKTLILFPFYLAPSISISVNPLCLFFIAFFFARLLLPLQLNIGTRDRFLHVFLLPCSIHIAKINKYWISADWLDAIHRSK